MTLRTVSKDQKDKEPRKLTGAGEFLNGVCIGKLLWLDFFYLLTLLWGLVISSI